MSTPIAKLASVTLDCADANALATFWQQVLGLNEEYANDDRTMIALRGDGPYVACATVDDYQAPQWPSAGSQVHLDLEVSDLDAAQQACLDAGATLPEAQPNPDVWRVLLDPAGHPFCLMLPFE